MKDSFSLLLTPGAASTILFISLTAFFGMLIGKVPFGKIKFGVAGVLFAGLLLGHLGAKIDASVIQFARDFGLILFVYSIGINIGPRFFSSFRNEGLKLNLFSSTLVLLGFATAYTIQRITGISPSTIAGIMCGAVTNTPGLGAAQQILAEQVSETAGSPSLAGMGYAVSYPFGIIGIIISMILIRSIFRINTPKEVNRYKKSFNKNAQKLETVRIKITNPDQFGTTVGYIKKKIDNELVISRIERDGKFLVPKENMILMEDDIIYGVSSLKHIDTLQKKVGKVDIGIKKEVSGDLAMFHVLVTNKKLAGKTIEQIGIYRRYEANITRIFRAGMEILPTHSTIVEMGDTVRIVGKRDLLEEIRKELGNSMMELAVPNTVPLFLGIILGIILGSLPVAIPGMPVGVKLGIAGGTLIVAILLGNKGRIWKLDFYMTPGANMMMRELGIIVFLSCVGLSSGGKFVSTITGGGYMWALYGAIITFVPLMIVGIAARLMKINYLKICGLLAGSMTDPPALEFANSIAPVQAQSTAYATVYPLTMFLRVLLAQVLIFVTM
jgi:putative transport protein